MNLKVGDWIACEKGHPQLLCVREIVTGSPFRSRDLVFSDGAQPPQGSNPEPCRICGLPVIIQNGPLSSLPVMIIRGALWPEAPALPEIDIMARARFFTS